MLIKSGDGVFRTRSPEFNPVMWIVDRRSD
jgi:hypothetical protein